MDPATGLKPLDYIHALRLEEATQMPETGDLAVEAIADEVGYQDANFFSRQFRRKTGLTAAQYRSSPTTNGNGSTMSASGQKQTE